MQRGQDEKQEELESSYYPWVYNILNVSGYCLGDLQTFLTLSSFPSPCMQVLQWLCLQPAALKILPLHSIICNQMSSLYSFCLLPTIVPFNMQEVTCQFVTPNFHKQGLAITFLWQPVVQGFKVYLMVSPLFFVLEEMQRY